MNNLLTLINLLEKYNKQIKKNISYRNIIIIYYTLYVRTSSRTKTRKK